MFLMPHQSHFCSCIVFVLQVHRAQTVIAAKAGSLHLLEAKISFLAFDH